MGSYQAYKAKQTAEAKAGYEADCRALAAKRAEKAAKSKELHAACNAEFDRIRDTEGMPAAMDFMMIEMARIEKLLKEM